MKAYVVIGVKNGKLKKIGEYNSYWSAIQDKNKAKFGGKYEQVELRENVPSWRSRARTESGLISNNGILSVED